MKPRKLIIQTGARLHFGPLSFRPKVGPEFGGLGMMIRKPGFEISLQLSDEDEIQSPKYLSQRITETRNNLRKTLNCCNEIPLRIEVSHEIPRHIGLGSGTQLGLAIAKGIAVLADANKLDIQELARLAGRGRRSAIGIHGFQQGGFLVDDGKPANDEIGKLSHRLDFPEHWRIVLVTPENQKGISGEREGSTFDRLEPMNASISNKLRKTIETAIIPALKQKDFTAFSKALTQYGKSVGEYFSRYQGGVFSFPDCSKVCEALDSLGVPGYGQTSWGPTLWIVQQNEKQATELVKTLKRKPVFSDSQFQIVEPQNEGADIVDM